MFHSYGFHQKDTLNSFIRLSLKMNSSKCLMTWFMELRRNLREVQAALFFMVI